MTTSYITLDNLIGRIMPVEDMPLPLQDAMKDSVRLTLLVNLIAIPALYVARSIMWSAWPVPDEGLFMFTSGWVNWLVEIALPASSWMLTFNIISLAMILLVLLVSKGMEEPVREEFHWLAGVAAFPSGASAIAAIVALTLFILIVIVTLIVWAFIIMLFIAGFFGALSSK